MSTLDAWLARRGNPPLFGCILPNQIYDDSENSTTLDPISEELRAQNPGNESLDRAIYCQKKNEVEITSRRLHSSSLPIFRLPVELLLAIFHLTARNGTPLLCALVCSPWKDIILGESGASLWTDLSIRDASASKLKLALRNAELYLKHSRLAPVSITICHSEVFASDSADAAALAATVSSAAERCIELNVHAEIIPMLFPLSNQWSQLASLSLILTAGILSRFPSFSIFDRRADLTSLRTVELTDLPGLNLQGLDVFFGSWLPFKMCTKLHLMIGDVGVTASVYLLRQFPNLQELSIREFFIDIEDGNVGPGASTRLNLPELRVLHVRLYDGFEDILGCIEAPLLQSLTMDAFIPVISHHFPDVPSLTINQLSVPGRRL